MILGSVAFLVTLVSSAHTLCLIPIPQDVLRKNAWHVSRAVVVCERTLAFRLLRDKLRRDGCGTAFRRGT